MVRITFKDAVAKVWPGVCYISGSDMSYFRTLLRRKSWSWNPSKSSVHWSFALKKSSLLVRIVSKRFQIEFLTSKAVPIPCLQYLSKLSVTYQQPHFFVSLSFSVSFSRNAQFWHFRLGEVKKKTLNSFSFLLLSFFLIDS